MILQEELTGQLAERIPTAIRAKAEATKDAGLTANGTEQEMFKLMEQGKLLAKDVMPAFAKQLRKTATDGNALGHALKHNLSVAIGQATFNLQQLSNEVFTGGLKDALKLVLDNFNAIGGKGSDLAYILGKVLGGAIVAVTTPFILLGAVLIDTWQFMKDVTNMTDEMSKSLISLAANVFGAYLGFKLLSKAFKAAKAIGAFGGKVLGGGSGAASGGAVSSAARTLNPAAIAAAAAGAAVLEYGGKGGGLSAGNIFGNNSLTNFLDTPIADLMPKSNAMQNQGFQPRNFQQNPKLELNIKTSVDESGNLQSYVDSRVENGQIEMVEQAFNSIGSLN